jgi:leader peptidase (prepilin peptidase)/N-methyltransferase
MFLIVFFFGLCLGSFINMLAYRLVHGDSLWTKRSHCPHCRTTIAWYDNIPLISWLNLRGKCRTCKQPISPLYPFIELLTALIATALFYKVFYAHITFATGIDPANLWIGVTDAMPLHLRTYQTFATYLVFFSALIAATRTDLEAMVIPQVFSLWLAPLGLIATYAGLTYITWLESALGVILGYGVLWLVAKVFTWGTGKEGMGIGDMELMALIGAFLGPFGVWLSLMLGSLIGLFLGGSYVVVTKGTRTTRIPFGPFLALGATIYFFWHRPLIVLLLG